MVYYSQKMLSSIDKVDNEKDNKITADEARQKLESVNKNMGSNNARELLNFIYSLIYSRAESGKRTMELHIRDVLPNKVVTICDLVYVVTSLRENGYTVNSRVDEHKHSLLNVTTGFTDVLIISW